MYLFRKYLNYIISITSSIHQLTTSITKNKETKPIRSSSCGGGKRVIVKQAPRLPRVSLHLVRLNLSRPIPFARDHLSAWSGRVILNLTLNALKSELRAHGSTASSRRFSTTTINGGMRGTAKKHICWRRFVKSPSGIWPSSSSMKVHLRRLIIA